MRTAIYGAGSLGTVLGAYLANSGVDVDLVNRNKAHVDALKKNGARITGTVDKLVPVKAMLPEEMTGTYDIIFLMTKQLNNREVVTFLKDYLAEDGVVVTLQNGIPEDSVAEIVGENRTIGCVVEWGATMTAPGESMLTSDPQSLNATFSGLGTVIGGTFGEVTGNAKAREIAIRCMKEVIDVGRGAGVEFAPVQGKNIVSLFYWRTPVKKALAKLILPVAMKKHAAIEPSMLQDLKKNKPCEVDAINGVVCGWGKKVGVPTPVNDRIVKLIREIQDGKRETGPDNLAEFGK